MPKTIIVIEKKNWPRGIRSSRTRTVAGFLRMARGLSGKEPAMAKAQPAKARSFSALVQTPMWALLGSTIELVGGVAEQQQEQEKAAEQEHGGAGLAFEEEGDGAAGDREIEEPDEDDRAVEVAPRRGRIRGGIPNSRIAGRRDRGGRWRRTSVRL
ncbi:hypothetical protein ACQ86N_38905 [Puia sp. P3]|uniref:hypothetical protein n=1 Tax=Puia sp. P3 TaxID=3423952 RepID=UPI003D66C00F